MKYLSKHLSALISRKILAYSKDGKSKIKIFRYVSWNLLNSFILNLNTLFGPFLFSDILFRCEYVLFLIKPFCVLSWFIFLLYFWNEVLFFSRFCREQFFWLIILFKFECEIDGNRCAEEGVCWPRFSFAVSLSHFL